MHRTSPIYKQELEQLLEEWGNNKISSKELHTWAELNYFPLHIDIAPDENISIQSAMHCILNEFDQCNPDYLKVDNYKVAIGFLNCTKETFEQKRKEFLDKRFKF